MSDETVFYILGGILAAGAVLISFLGLRAGSFPPSRGVLAAGIGAFALLVAGTGTFAVLGARAEQEHRRAEQAHAEEEAKGESAERQSEEQSPVGGEPSGQETASELAVSSPEDGSLEFEPDGLEAQAGEVTITYDNPSQVPHNIALELEGRELVVSDTITADTTSISQALEPGEYVFYCAVPTHRENGMEGDLTVTGPQQP